MSKIYKTEWKHQKIKIDRLGRAEEYYGKYDETSQHTGPYARYLQEYGIVAHYTMLGTPEQNGMPERQKQSLIDMVRCIVSKCNLPKRLLGKPLQTTNYI